jgi:hypothetical protein
MTTDKTHGGEVRMPTKENLYKAFRAEAIRAEGLGELSKEHVMVIRAYKRLKFENNNISPSPLMLLRYAGISLKYFVELFPNKMISVEALSAYVY